jgi:hypothetical protein
MHHFSFVLLLVFFLALLRLMLFLMLLITATKILDFCGGEWCHDTHLAGLQLVRSLKSASKYDEIVGEKSQCISFYDLIQKL